MPEFDESSTLDVPQYPRGVYVSRVRARDGALVVFAVDSQGRTAGKIALRGITTLESATRLLQARLDEVNPLPSLRIIPRGESRSARNRDKRSGRGLTLMGAETG